MQAHRYVIYGSALPVDVDLLNLSPNQGFAIYETATSDYSGWSVSTAGDVNRDGYVDVLIGAYNADLSSKI